MAPLLPFSSFSNNGTGGATNDATRREATLSAKHSIRGHQGLISAQTRGTIEAEINNLDRRLIAVRWDNGLQMYVFPDEIEIEDTLSERNWAAS